MSNAVFQLYAVHRMPVIQSQNQGGNLSLRVLTKAEKKYHTLVSTDLKAEAMMGMKAKSVD